MSRNGNGQFNLVAGNPVVTATTISSTWANNTLSDIANALTQSIAADGQTTITGPLKGLDDTVAIAGVGQFALPVGTTAERSVAPYAGMIRYNTTFSQYEGYSGGAWNQIGGGATGAGGDAVFVENGTVVTTSYTLSTSKNAMSVGPITVNSGQTVEIPSGQRWVVL
jgi:hypothetical protein